MDYFPNDIVNIICDFIDNKPLEWIHADNLSICELSSNVNAIHMLNNNIHSLDWKKISANPNAISLVKRYPKYIHWPSLSANLNAIDILSQNQDKIDWYNLSANPNAINLIVQNLDKIDWSRLCSNTSPKAMDLLIDNIDKIDWNILYTNPAAVIILNNHITTTYYKYLFENPNIFKIISKDRLSSILNESKTYVVQEYMEILSKNPTYIKVMGERYELNFYSLSLNPNAIRILEHNTDKINWDNLSLNPNAIQLLKKNRSKINWFRLSSNPSIFIYDMSKITNILKSLCW